MKNLHSTLTIFLFLIAYNVFAIDYEWAGRYNAGALDRGLHAMTNSSNDGYLAGVSEFPGGSKIVLSKYTEDGALIKLNAGNTFLSSSDVKQIERNDDHDAYVLCENSTTSYTLIKYNKNAIEKWRRTFLNYVVGFELGHTGGVYVSYLTDAGMTVKRLHTSNGTTNWTRNIADDQLISNKSLNDFTIDINDNTYFGGTTNTGPSGDDYRLVKINKNNVLLYNKRFTTPGENDEEVFKIEASTSGNLYVVGDYNNDIPSRTYFHMVKFNSSGNFLWATLYDNSGPTAVYFPLDIELGPDGHPVVVGTDNDFFNINPAGEVRRIRVSKFNKSTGAIVFNVFPNDASNTADDLRETAICMTIDSHNNIFFGGISNVYAGVAVEPDRWMIAKASGVDGAQQWVDASTANNDPANQVNDITVTDDDFVYMAVTENLGASTDMGLIRYCQVGCFVARYSAPSEEIPMSVYPNPSPASFTLKTFSTNENLTEMTVMSLEGKLIESRIISTEEYQFGDEYKAGIYIVRLSNPNFSRIIRIVKTE